MPFQEGAFDDMKMLKPLQKQCRTLASRLAMNSSPFHILMREIYRKLVDPTGKAERRFGQIICKLAFLEKKAKERKLLTYSAEGKDHLRSLSNGSPGNLQRTSRADTHIIHSNSWRTQKSAVSIDSLTPK